jgi:hypothetical protein
VVERAEDRALRASGPAQLGVAAREGEGGEVVSVGQIGVGPLTRVPPSVDAAEPPQAAAEEEEAGGIRGIRDDDRHPRRDDGVFGVIEEHDGRIGLADLDRDGARVDSEQQIVGPVGGRELAVVAGDELHEVVAAVTVGVFGVLPTLILRAGDDHGGVAPGGRHVVVLRDPKAAAAEVGDRVEAVVGAVDAAVGAEEPPLAVADADGVDGHHVGV